MNKDEIAQWYGSNYEEMLMFIRNKKKGGDGRRVTKEQAEDILSATFVYFLGSPDKFDSKWIWNKLIQMRKNFHRDESSKVKFEKEYREHLIDAGEDRHNDYDEEVEIYTEFIERNYKILTLEVDNVSNIRHKEIIESYIKGEQLGTSARKMVINRFKEHLKEKYGDSMDDGYRE